MMNVFARLPRDARRAWQGPVRPVLMLTSALVLPGTAWADCTATGNNVTCSGASPSYTNSASGLSVSASATTVLQAPLTIGPNGSLTLASGGTIQGSTATAAVQFGDNATITNNGTITSSSTTAGAGAIQVGANSTVTNNGTLTAAAGTPAVSFVANTSTNGTFNIGATAPAAVTGDVQLGYNTGTNVGTFNNAFNTTTTATSTATYGLSGNVIGQGNVVINNQGQWTGSLSQTAAVAVPASTVSFVNGPQANFNGVIVTGDTTTVINNATGKNLAGVAYGMVIANGSAGSSLGASTSASTASSSLTNNGTLSIGSTAAPALVKINGSFLQSAAGTLNIAIAKGGTAVVVGAASQPYSQVLATGTAQLAGTLNVNVLTGFYPNRSVFQLVVANQGITGNFSTVNVTNANNQTLPFISFVNLGIVTINGTQQAYEVQSQRNGTYASVVAPTATPNELKVATALQPLTAVADANTTGLEAALIGQIDQLTVAQANNLFNQLSPAGYLNYASALRDQANSFERVIQLRMGDQNSDHAENGWWGTFDGQVDTSKVSGDATKDKLFGINLGYDLSGPHHVFGVAGSISWDSLHNADRSLTGKNRDYALAAYAGYNLGMIHLTGQVAYNFGHLSAHRNLTLSSTAAAAANASASEHLFKAIGTAGVVLQAAGYNFEPFAGVDFATGKIKGFTETGDGAAALTVLPIKADRTDLLAGLAVTRAAGKFRPYLRATYRSEIGNGSDTNVTAYFDGNNATQFTVAGVRPSRHEVDANAGINVVFEDAGSLFLGYQGTFRSGYQSHGINLGVRLEF